jgi:disulfide bond formation protein DsbB
LNRPSTACLPNSRAVNGAGLLIIVAAMLFALFYLEGVLYLVPCPLCIIDRVVLTGIGLVFLLAAVHNPGRTGQRVYAGLNLALVGLGFAVAGRHVWLQHLPADRVPECGASLDYMLETLPLHQTLKKVLQGSGECADVQWTLLGLSIPEQTLLLFAALGALVLLQLLRRSD